MFTHWRYRKTQMSDWLACKPIINRHYFGRTIANQEHWHLIMPKIYIPLTRLTDCLCLRTWLHCKAQTGFITDTSAGERGELRTRARFTQPQERNSTPLCKLWTNFLRHFVKCFTGLDYGKLVTRPLVFYRWQGTKTYQKQLIISKNFDGKMTDFLGVVLVCNNSKQWTRFQGKFLQAFSDFN